MISAAYGGSYVNKRTASTPSRKWPHAALDSTLRLISDATLRLISDATLRLISDLRFEIPRFA